MAIMKLLAELYHFADLRLNLKFEIEVLCKKIRLDIKDISPTLILRNRQIKNMRGSQGKGTTQGEDDLSATPASLSSVQAPALSLASQTSDDSQMGYPQLASYLTFNPNLPIFKRPALS
ncbi:hypothetical protein BC829DRAFT_684 [Chytridium lagenaria]|nr:hypothetical protein BC829DRAFT_684 [Chytridium lagenaria]